MDGHVNRNPVPREVAVGILSTTMPWSRNKALLEEGLRDLAYVPRGRCDWDCTLCCLAFGARLELARSADLASWAVRHGVPASKRYVELAGNALVLWHGTSRQRAQKIVEHGLFSKRGVWAAANPALPHGFCRCRSEQFSTEGAVVCIVLDRREVIEGRHYEYEGGSHDVYRFHQPIGSDAVQYLLTHEQVSFTGTQRARHPAPWPTSRFKRTGGRWVPRQQAPVRYGEQTAYSTPREFASLVISRLLQEQGSLAPIEAFSAVYSAVRPWDVIEHDQILQLLDGQCGKPTSRGKWQVFRPKQS